MPRHRFTGFLAVANLILLAGTLSSCSSCSRPAEPVLPADLSGSWSGAYTVYDGVGRGLTDSLLVTLLSDEGDVSGEGVRSRHIKDRPTQEAPVVVVGSVVANSFRLEFGDPETGHTALFSGTLEDDTLAGNLIVDGDVLARLHMARNARYGQGMQK